MRILPGLIVWYRAICVWAIALLLAFVAFNVVAGLVLAFFPKLMRSEGQIVAAMFDKIRRDHLKRGDEFLRWYDARSVDEVVALWQEFSAVPVRYAPYVQFEIPPFAGRYYTVAEGGFRKSKVDGPWPPSSAGLNIFFFGGSTAQGETSNDTTIASYLQQAVQARLGPGRPVYVYNFGRSSYQSTQEKILLQQLLAAGLVPDAVIFLDGLNDFCFADGNPSGWETVRFLYDNYHEEFMRRAKGTGAGMGWKSAGDFLAGLPLVRLASAVGSNLRVATPAYEPPAVRPEKIEFKDPPPEPAMLHAVIRRYRENVRQIRALAGAYGLVPFFVWQPIPTYKYDLRYHEFVSDRLYCHINSKFGYPLMADSIRAQTVDPNFIWAADIQEFEKTNLYVDSVHYSAPMSKKIGDVIAGAVVTRLRR